MRKGVSQSSLKFFIRHVALAAGRQMERESKIDGLSSQITMLKKSAKAPKPSKKKLELGLDELDKRIKDVINEERLLVINQQREERVIEELKERLDLLEEKVHGLGHVHSITSDDHIKKIDNMGKKLGDVLARVAERKGKLRAAEYNPKRIVTQVDDINKRKLDKIKKLEEMIGIAEKAHADLKKKKVPKHHLDRLKETIDMHKKKIKSLKK